MAARTKARKRAVDVLFEAAQRDIAPLDLLAVRQESPGTQAPLPEYSAELVAGVARHRDRIDEALATYAQGWSLDRMPAVDLAILRVGAWEVLYGEVDDAVAVDEAVELARTLSTDESPTFVNGLLGRLVDLKDTLI